MIFNIVDKRERKDDWCFVNIVFEPHHIFDNQNTKQELYCVSLAKAIEIGQELDYAVKMIIYDFGPEVANNNQEQNELKAYT